ncbi:RNA-dependent RNA polymerase [Phytophthora condilina negative stranded RNA virus 2]|nr:RNA-dependent RNA polymerase [Phytophthora condilina negative stranded RNA virus 2]
MTIKQDFESAKRELSSLKFKSISYFRDFEEKKEAIRQAEDKVEKLNQLFKKEILKKELNSQTKEKLINVLGIDSYNDKLKEFSNSIYFNIKKLFPVTKKDFSWQVDDDFTISKIDFETLSRLYETVDLIRPLSDRLNHSYILFAITVSVMDHLNSTVMNGKDYLEAISLIIGTIFKLRVGVMTDILLLNCGINSEQDIPFHTEFGIDSIRTPDFIQNRSTEAIIMESNFSSRNVKGVYSKGLTIDQSKYYEEMYYIKTRLNKRISYFPLIFYHEMETDSEWKEAEKLFIDDNSLDEFSSIDSKNIRNFFLCLKGFSDKFKVNKESRENMMIQMRNMLSIISLMNNQIYPRGKMLNRCFSYINEPENVFSIVDTDFGVRKVVEYNRRQLECSLYEMKALKYVDLFEYLFKGSRKNADITRLKRLAFLFASDLKRLFHEDEVVYNEKIIEGLKSTKDLIFNKIGIISFGKNSRNEKLQMLINFERLNDFYFELADIGKKSFYINEDLKLENKMSEIPVFTFVKNIEPPDNKKLLDLETKKNIIYNDLEGNLDMNVSYKDLEDLSPGKLMKMLNIGKEEKTYYCKISSETLEKFVLSTNSIPVIMLVITDISLLSTVYDILFDNIYVGETKFVEAFNDYEEISFTSASFNTIDIDQKVVDKLTNMIESIDNVEYFDRTKKVLCLKNVSEEENIFIKDERLKIIKSEDIIEFEKKLMTYKNTLNGEFSEFKFNSLDKNYLKDINVNKDQNYIVKKMTELILDQQELSTKRNKYVNYHEIIDLMGTSSLNKSEPFIIPSLSLCKEGDIKNSVITDFKAFNTLKQINKLKMKAEKEGQFKQQGIVFFPDHIEVKKIKLSYSSDKVHKLINSMSKIINGPKLNNDVEKVIEHCCKKRMESRNNHAIKIKTFIPNDNEVKELKLHYLEMSNDYSEIDEFKFTLVENSFKVDTDLDISNNVLENFEKVLNSNSYIKSLYRLSRIYESISFEITKWNIHANEVIFSDENFTNISYMILPGRKIVNDITKARYMIFLNSERNDNYSIFKNNIKGTNIFFTNVHEEDIELLKFRADLFTNVYTLFLYLWKKNIYSDEEIKCGFLMVYHLLFSVGTGTKNILSIFKYLNILNFSDYCNPFNLFVKYFTKDKHNRTLSYLFMKKIIDNYNRNLKTISEKTGVLGDSLSEVRSKTIKIENLKTLFGEVDNLKDLIESNTFYNFVEKKTTNIRHSYSKFVTTIIENNNFLKQVNEEGVSIDEITAEDIMIKNKSLFCKESLYHGIKLIFNDVFSNTNNIDSSDKLLKLEFSKCRQEKKLTKEFFSKIMTKRVYERFSSTYLSSRKSLIVNKKAESKTVKQRMIDSTLEYIETIFGNNDTVSPVELYEKTFELVEKNVKFKGVDIRKLTNLCALSKKEQHESDREIYVLFIVTKILTVFIQTVFYSINMLINGEMVVKPTVSKYSLIKEMTSEIYKLPGNTEIIFMNGDMASWSGRDIYSKFLFMCDSMHELGVMDDDVLNMTKFAFKMTEKMVIILPDERDDAECVTDSYFGRKSLVYEKSWPQGIYHNPSSFIHACEQRLKTEILRNVIKNNFSHKFLDHSDDKNEIINLKMNDYEKYVKISNYSPCFFSLKPSQTKDSFSRIISEMVGVQNVKGKIFDNPVKSLRGAITRTKSPFFIVNYKSCLSSISSFFDKSNDIVMSDCLNTLAYSHQTRVFGIPIESFKELPIDMGGKFLMNMDSYDRYGKFVDILDKFFTLKKNKISINKLYKSIDFNFEFKKDENMRKIYRRFKDYRDIDKMTFDIEESKTNFTNNILRSKIQERIEMFRKRDSLTDVMNIKNQGYNHLIFSFQENLISASQKSIHELTELCTMGDNELLDKDLIIDDKVIDSFIITKQRKLKSVDITNKKDIRDMNDHSMKLTRIGMGVSFLSFETFEDLIEGNFKKVFKSYRNKNEFENISLEFSNLLRHFNINNMIDFKEKKKVVKNLLEGYKRKELVQFRPFNDDIPELNDFNCEIALIKDDETKISKEINQFSSYRRPKKTKADALEVINTIKSMINESLINNLDLNIPDVEELIAEKKISNIELFKRTNDKYLKSLFKYIFKSQPNYLVESKTKIELKINKKYKLKTVEKMGGKDEIGSYVIYFVLTLNGEFIDVLVKYDINKFYLVKNNLIKDGHSIIKSLIHYSNFEFTDKSFDPNLEYKLEICELEGVFYNHKTDEFVVQKEKRNTNVKRFGNNFVEYNEITSDFFSIEPVVYTEISSFKRQIFNTSYIMTDSKGGTLNSTEKFHEFDLDYIPKFRPRFSLSRKFRMAFNRSIRRLTDFKVRTCSIIGFHTHSTNENIVCLKSKVFNMTEGETVVHISEDTIDSSISEASDESGFSMDKETFNLLSGKIERFRKRGKLTGGEILVCDNPDDFNLMKIDYIVPEETNELNTCMEFLWIIIQEQLRMKEKTKPIALKENINLYRTMRCIMETDDRFDRNFNLTVRQVSEIEAMREFKNQNYYEEEILQFNIIDEINRKSKDTITENSLINRIAIILGKFIDISDDKRYHTTYLNFNNILLDPSVEKLESIYSKRLEKIREEVAINKKTYEEILNNISDFIPREDFDKKLKDEMESFKSNFEKEFWANISSIKMENKSLKENLDTKSKRIEELLTLKEVKNVIDNIITEIEVKDHEKKLYIESKRIKYEEKSVSRRNEESNEAVYYMSDSESSCKNFGFKYFDESKKEMTRIHQSHVGKKNKKKTLEERRRKQKEKREKMSIENMFNEDAMSCINEVISAKNNKNEVMFKPFKPKKDYRRNKLELNIHTVEHLFSGFRNYEDIKKTSSSLKLILDTIGNSRDYYEIYRQGHPKFKLSLFSIPFELQNLIQEFFVSNNVDKIPPEEEKLKNFSNSMGKMFNHMIKLKEFYVPNSCKKNSLVYFMKEGEVINKSHINKLKSFRGSFVYPIKDLLIKRIETSKEFNHFLEIINCLVYKEIDIAIDKMIDKTGRRVINRGDLLILKEIKDFFMKRNTCFFITEKLNFLLDYVIRINHELDDIIEEFKD